MRQGNVLELTRYRTKREKGKERDRLNAGKRGRVYARGGKLWVDFRYLGERVREPSGLKDTPTDRKTLRRQLDLVMAEIENGVFEFAKRFPHSKRRDHFTLLEGRAVIKDPREALFGKYAERWMEEMKPGMSFSQLRDYTIILRAHHLPYFAAMPFSEICSRVLM